MMARLRHDDFPQEIIASARRQVSNAIASCVDLLRVELAVAQTFLDLAANARDETARMRRTARAAEAASLVGRFVSVPEPPVSLPPDVREQLANELDKVYHRITLMR